MTAPVPDRVLTQNALTGQWLSTALPLTELEYGNELNGPGSLTGKLAPRLLSSNPAVVDPDNTFIYVESAGQIVWGGVIWDVRSEGNEYTVEAASWSSYLQHRYDLDGQHGGRGPYTYADRCQVIRNIWTYAQGVADGNLSVIVDSTTSTSTIGTPSDVYNSFWYDMNCLGDQVDDLVSGDATPDYTCATSWNADKTAIVKRIRLGWPRLGRRRSDITFTSGVNIIEDPEVVLGGDDYAQVVIVTGSGDGSAKLRQISAVRNGRIRMEAAVDAPELNGNDTLKARANWERAWRQVLGSIDEITVRDTTAAPFGSYQIGDDIYTRVHNTWTDFAGWCRITGWSRKPTAQGGPQTVVSLKPSAMYNYGSA
ncbi:hypothetical protein [Streptomyces sp. NPDC008092]|uniref:hypothetical protein n=1 Tax=Streptomyces sp. NPDC008092 TaxID=3364808 RepID=UPI0036EF12F3